MIAKVNLDGLIMAMKRLVLMLIMNVWVFFGGGAAHAAPVNWVYRIDYYPPSEVFKNGFRAFGQNMDIYSHLSGQACVAPTHSNGDSGFINTVADLDTLRGIATRMVRTDPRHRTLYLYRVRADGNFYDAIPSLEAYENAMPDGIGDISPTTYQAARLARTFIVPRYIEPANIMEADEVAFDIANNTAHIGNRVHNNNYINTNSASNDSPFPVPTLVTQRTLSTWFAMLPVVAACVVNKINRPGDDLRLSENDWLKNFTEDALSD